MWPRKLLASIDLLWIYVLFPTGRDEATKVDIFGALCTLIDGCFWKKAHSYSRGFLHWNLALGMGSTAWPPEEGRRSISVHCCTRDFPDSHSYRYRMSRFHWSSLASRISMGCAKAGRQYRSIFFLLWGDVMDELRCHHVYEARTDHLKKTEHPFCLGRTTVIFTSMTRTIT